MAKFKYDNFLSAPVWAKMVNFNKSKTKVETEKLELYTL